TLSVRGRPDGQQHRWDCECTAHATLWFQRGNDLWTVLPDEARVHARSFRGRRGPLVAFRKALAPASCARVARARLSTIVKGSARQFIRTIGPTLSRASLGEEGAPYKHGRRSLATGLFVRAAKSS